MTAEELERQAEENLAGCRMSLDSIARWFRADASAIRDYTPMADAVPTRTEAGIVADFPASRYLFERAGRVRAAIPEEEAYYEDRRRSGAWPDLYATPDLPDPETGPAKPQDGTHGDPRAVRHARGGEPALIHELEFLDREARPATWRARCGTEDAPLEQTTSVPGNVTCPDCRAASAGSTDLPGPSEPFSGGSGRAGESDDEDGYEGTGWTQAEVNAALAENARRTYEEAASPDDAPALDEHSEEALGRFLDAHAELDAEAGDSNDDA